MIISAIIIKYTYDYRLKKKVIESIGIDDITIEIFKSQADNLRYSYIRWGMFFVTLGLGIYTSDLLKYNIYQPVFYSIPCVFVGIGFIVSSIIKKG